MRSNIVTMSIGVGEGKFLGVRRVFVRILPNLKESSACYFGRRWAPFFVIFLGVCSDFQGFCESFQRFSQDFHGFSVIFFNLKS